MYVHVLLSPLYTAVSIGFSTLFTRALESSGQVSVTVEMKGQSELPVTIGVATHDNTATG